MAQSGRRHSMAPVTTSPSRIPTSPSSSSSGIPTRLSHRTSVSMLSNKNTQSPVMPLGSTDNARPGSSVDTVKRPASTPLRRAPSREMLKKPDGESANVQVVLRIRPSQQPDQNIPARFTRTVLQPSPTNPTNEVLINLSNEPNKPAQPSSAPAPAAGNKGKQTSFRYDRVLGEDSLQSEVFESAGKTAVDKFISGLNVTVLAYGQTSSGKSYTMGTTGIDDDYHPSGDIEADSNDRTGMIPRAMSEIFKRAEAKRRESGSGASWDCRLSFLELYNEELIDLLSNLPQAQSPPIIIREDKGRILWSGLHEISVKTTSDVLRYLREGSAKRRTGETGMNKESSRSHAIFSLTLVQTRRTGDGNGTPGGKGRPMSTPNGPPSSMRSPTPSGIRTPNRTSMFAGRGMNGSGRITPSTSLHDDEASWVETSSKFHFVDLAGSERLKRTGAGGDRMKEGISINAGLLALGNVISALADPNKNKSLHIPYRDSKLTRLLQDSLGGNAFTVMIACVSAIEYNLNETLSTLKYGARARLIKNRAEVNELEVGWEDVEHLQGTVVKLRAEVLRLKAMAGSGERSGTPTTVSEEVEAELRECRARLQELETEHDVLRDDLQTKSLQFARLVTDLETTKRSGSFNPDDVNAFSQLVEPIVEEYERLIQALEGKLQAALASLELSEERAAEAEEIAAQREHRMSRQDTYVADLVGRLNRLKDKEKTFDDYINDLEEKLRSFEDLDVAHQRTLSELRAELSMERSQSKNAAEYIATMESAMSQSESDIKEFNRKLERLEAELKRKEDSHLELQERIKLVDTTEDNQLLLKELEEKNVKLANLERDLEDSLFSKQTLGAERDLLRRQTDEQTRQLAVLQSRVDQVPKAVADGSSIIVSKAQRPLSVSQVNDTSEEDSPGNVPGSPTTPVAAQHSLDSNQAGYTVLNPEVVELQEKHAQTLAELSAISDRYKEALEKITELTSQVVEAEEANRDSSDSGKDVSPSSMAISRTASASSIASAVSASPERARRTRSVGNELVVKPDKTDFQRGRGDRMGDARPVSLSQELSLSRLSRSSFGSGTSLLSPLGNSRQNLPSRSTVSLEAEIKQLQEVLRRRDDEIRVLENAMRSMSGTSPRFENAGQFNMYHNPPGRPELVHGLSSPSSTAFQNSLPLTPNDQHHVDPLLTPTTTRHFTILKEQKNGDSTHDEAGEIDRIDRLDTLMRSMARKEVEHKQEVEDLNRRLKATLQEMAAVKDSREQPVPTPSDHVRPDQAKPGPASDLNPSDGLKPTIDAGVQTRTQSAEIETDHTKVKELQQTLTGFQTAIADLVFDFSLVGSEVSDGGELDSITGINRIATALAQADATEISLRAELSQLRAQTSELADVKLSLEAAAQEKSAREGVIKELERRLQELSNVSRRQSETSDSDREPPAMTGPRMSFGRAATPTSKIPPIQPPPNMPPPPLPPLPEGLPSQGQRHDFPSGGNTVSDEQKGRSPSPSSPVDVPKNRMEEENQALRRQMTDHEQTIAGLRSKIKTADFSLQENSATIKSLSDNLQSSEKTLRKLRLQAQEHTRERDLAEAEVQRLQAELDHAQKEVASVRSSIIIEKRSLEDRLSEERRAKERTQKQFEQRLEAVQAKQSKFRCF